MSMHLKGKTAVVTGAGRGIGREVAKTLAAEGVNVIVNDPGVGRGGEKTEERPADDVVAEIRKAGGKASANYDSVADYLKAGLMIKQCVDEFGKIDIVVNVAGNLRERMIWNMSEDDFDAVVAVHLKGQWNMLPSRNQVHASGRMRAHRELLIRRIQGLRWAVQLQRIQGRHHRADALDC
jgi:NAD(P)-dependent dehydrogenase (short-subunit alcohol dehydrogenase family)